ncbi:MAG: hypothetical protein ACLFRV_06020 [Acidimicrobiales bacterium]
MTRLDHLAEPISPTGGLNAEGALKLLGRPALDPLVILMREAAQNSWDARRNEETVNFGVDLRAVDHQVRRVLTDQIFTSLPPQQNAGEGETTTTIAESLAMANLRLLLVTDTGTTGLDGGTRPDLDAPDDPHGRFANLVYFIGEAQGRTFGGGSYGFGKTISYLISQCRTVIIHTATEHNGRLEQRLIAQAIGNRYAHEGRHHTGRHWWGRTVDDRVEPVVDDEATALAQALGLPDLDAAGGGTTLAIVDPDLGDRDPSQACTFMANALTWNFWPKMVADPGIQPTMHFTVSNEGREVDVPDPGSTPPLEALTQALLALRHCESGRTAPSDNPVVTIRELYSKRPKALLGWLAVLPAPALPRPEPDEGEVDGEPVTAAPFTGPAHHVALIRQPELIVTYHPGPELPTPDIEWVGVFKAAKNVDEAFKDAEPPTHDDWHPELVGVKRNATYVRVALREIKAALRDVLAPSEPAESRAQADSGVLIADALGHLITNQTGTGASVPASHGSERSDGSATNAGAVVHRQWIEESDSGTSLNVEFSVTPALGADATLVEVLARAAIGDGAPEKDPPVGASIPAVTHISEGSTTHETDHVVLPATSTDRLVATIHLPEGVAAAVDINLSSEPVR